MRNASEKKLADTIFFSLVIFCVASSARCTDESQNNQNNNNSSSEAMIQWTIGNKASRTSKMWTLSDMADEWRAARADENKTNYRTVIITGSSDGLGFLAGPIVSVSQFIWYCNTHYLIWFVFATILPRYIPRVRCTYNKSAAALPSVRSSQATEKLNSSTLLQAMANEFILFFYK